MKNIKKVFLFLTIVLVTLVINSNISFADTKTVSDEDTLVEAISNATAEDVISLSASIELTKPIEITDKTVTINGNGFTISRKDTNWTPNGNNGTLITAGANSKLTLMNITLSGSQKYGVQAYNGGYVVLDNVTIADCEFGGVLINAGKVEIKNLTLKKNGKPEYNLGIEIAKAQSLSDSPNEPTLIMNGSLTSTETDQVIYVDINDPVGDFEVMNTENTVNKIYVSGDKLVITDQNDTVLYESNEIENIDIQGDPYVKNITITIDLLEEEMTFTVKEGDTITENDLLEMINLDLLNLGNYTLNGFYSDENYTEPFNFENAITQDTTIYAKLTLTNTPTPTETPEDDQNAGGAVIPDDTDDEEQKDDTPKTGSDYKYEVAIFVIAISTIAVIMLRKKEF